MPTPQEARLLMKQLQDYHVKAAVDRIDAGERGEFADSTKYDMVYGGKRYAPKRVVGLALEEFSGEKFNHGHFKGGEESLAFRTLQRLKFEVKDKDGVSYKSRIGKYGKLTREWVLEAIKANGGRATKAEIEAYIKPRVPEFNVSNIDPDLQLMTVNMRGRSAWTPNSKPRRCDGTHELDVLFREEAVPATYVLFDVAKHGLWELAFLPGEEVVRPRLLVRPEEASALLNALADAQSNNDFDAKNDSDARKKVLRGIAMRLGQPRFRRDLMTAYECRCAVTGCDAEDALEAAHIMPYKGEHTNAVKNGLLLRADIHTLFDLGLLTINPETYTVALSPALTNTRYKNLAGAKLRLPKLPSLHPDKEALQRHRERLNLVF
jgi:hypothetical protein